MGRKQAKMSVSRRQTHQPHVLPPPGEVLEIILGAGASARQIQEAIPDVPALRPRLHVKAPGGGIQIHSGSNLIQPQTKTPSIGSNKYGDRPTINENIGDMTILPVGRRGGEASRRANNSLADWGARSSRQILQRAARLFLENTEFGGPPKYQPERVWELALGAFHPSLRLALPSSIPKIVLPRVLGAKRRKEQFRNWSVEAGLPHSGNYSHDSLCQRIMYLHVTCEPMPTAGPAMQLHKHVGSADLGL